MRGRRVGAEAARVEREPAVCLKLSRGCVERLGDSVGKCRGQVSAAGRGGQTLDLKSHLVALIPKRLPVTLRPGNYSAGHGRYSCQA